MTKNRRQRNDVCTALKHDIANHKTEEDGVVETAVKQLVDNIGCPTTYQTRQFFNNFTTNEDIATKFRCTTDTFLFISHTTNVLLFKSRCNIFIGFGIIKELPGLVGSGTPCTRHGLISTGNREVRPKTWLNKSFSCGGHYLQRANTTVTSA